MIEPKPLSREQLKSLRQSVHYFDRCCWSRDEHEAMLAAEAYWREAVKNASVFSGRTGCPFCGSPSLHPPDCPVLLAQDDK